MRLDVGVLAAEQRQGPVDRQLLDDVDLLAAAVVAATGVAFGVLVGEHGPAAWRTAWGTKFSEAIISSVDCWRSSSRRRTVAISGSPRRAGPFGSPRAGRSIELLGRRSRLTDVTRPSRWSSSGLADELQPFRLGPRIAPGRGVGDLGLDLHLDLVPGLGGPLELSFALPRGFNFSVIRPFASACLAPRLTLPVFASASSPGPGDLDDDLRDSLPAVVLHLHEPELVRGRRQRAPELGDRAGAQSRHVDAGVVGGDRDPERQAEAGQCAIRAAQRRPRAA